MTGTVSPPPSAALIPRPADLRAKLATALQEVAILRRLIRVAESMPTVFAVQLPTNTPSTTSSTTNAATR